MLIRRQFLAAASLFGAAVWTPAPVGAQSGEAEARTFIQTLGDEAVRTFSDKTLPRQQAEYQRLFEQLIINTYAGRFLEYSGETFKVTGARAESGTDSAVATQIVRPNGPPITLEWRVRHRDGHSKIIDVVFEGVSMGVTQRQEFASVIQQNGGKVDGLIQALRQKVG